MKRNSFTLLFCSVLSVALTGTVLFAQPGVFSREDLIKYTPEWQGERFPDGRPRVPDGILERMRSVTLLDRGLDAGQTRYPQGDRGGR